MSRRLRIMFAGSGAFGLPTLRSLCQAHDVVHAYSQPDRPAGRGRVLTPTPVSTFAFERGIPLTRTPDLNVERLAMDFDALVVIAFGQKISEAVVSRPRLGAMNLHASLLPRHRGAAPVNWSILSGDQTTGNSVIRLAARMDAGAVLGQSMIVIGQDETAGELHDRLAADGGPLMLRVLEELDSGTAVEREQNHNAATVARKLNRELAAINWAQPADAVARQIRGLSPWPGCRVRVVGPANKELARCTLLRAVGTDSALPGLSNVPGTILSGHDIATGLGSVRVQELQPDGRRKMTLEEYRNGRDWPIGGRLESIVGG